jgi:hypothetical protein
LGKICASKECPVIAESLVDTVSLYFEGKEGRSVGSPFGGHDRWTGNKIGKLMALSTIVFGVPEPFSSCTCSLCGHRIQKGARSVVKKKKCKDKDEYRFEIATTRVNGTLECQNPKCIAFQHGRSLKTRDAESGLSFLKKLLTNSGSHDYHWLVDTIITVANAVTTVSICQVWQNE